MKRDSRKKMCAQICTNTTVFFLFCSSQRVDGTTRATCWVSLRTHWIQNKSLVQLNVCAAQWLCVCLWHVTCCMRYFDAAGQRNHRCRRHRKASQQYAAFHSQQIYYGLFFSFLSASCFVSMQYIHFPDTRVSQFSATTTTATAQCGSFCSYFSVSLSLSLFKECTMFPVLFSIQSDFRFCGGIRRQANVPTRGRRVPKKTKRVHTKRKRQGVLQFAIIKCYQHFFAIRTREYKRRPVVQFGWAEI